MEFPREDLLYIRTLIAEKGDEMTPTELEDLLKEVDPDIVITDECGLASYLEELKRQKGSQDL